MAGQRRDLAPVVREGVAGVAALALSVIVVAHLVASDRVALLYSDGDSLITVLVARSLAAGQPQDWAMSSVLFIPEIAAFCALSLLGLPIVATLTLNAVLNVLALYAALRFIANSRGAAVAGFAAFAGFALLESTASRESLELASLMAPTTYYAATVLGVLVTIGLLLRLPGRPIVTVLAGIVAFVCTTSNPIFLAWAVVPLGLALVAARHLPVRVRVLAGAALIGGAALGMLARIPLAPWITNTGAGYVQPERWAESLGYYGDLVADRLQDLGGLVAVVAWGILMVLGAALTVVAIRRRDARSAMLAGVSWMAPLLVIVGAIALGTHAARYLQPVVFLPVLALVVLVGMLSPAHRTVMPAVAALLGVVAAVVSPPLVQVASQPYPSDGVACVTDWVEASGRVGAGQFWSVRAPKAYADDPAQLVQVDVALNEYAWLVNRTDFARERVSFLVTDDQSFDFDLPAGLADEQVETIDCGSYRILDFGRPIVPLGPPHS